MGPGEAEAEEGVEQPPTWALSPLLPCSLAATNMWVRAAVIPELQTGRGSSTEMGTRSAQSLWMSSLHAGRGEQRAARTRAGASNV
jgi:hypothetical protein